MDITVVGRHMDVPEKFRRHVEGKLEKVTQLAPNAHAVKVEISQEKNPRRAEYSDRVELTVHDGGNVIRSEARADDLLTAFDLAYSKLLERLRRARDRRKDRHRGRTRAHQSTVESVRHMTGEIETVPAASATPSTGPEIAEGEAAFGDGPGEHEDSFSAQDGDDNEASSPIVIREKKHQAAPMSVDDALYQMELVGHDFFLFIDEATANPKVVYRRKGWNYGVIELESEPTPSAQTSA